MSARLGRLHLNVSDVERAARFYTQVLGFRISARAGGLVFLSSGELAHHDLALHEVPGSVGEPPITRGVASIGFEVPGRVELSAVCDRLVRSGARVTAMDQGISLSLHTTDPDGHRIEVYCDTRHEARERPAWNGVRAVAAAEMAASLSNGPAADTMTRDDGPGVTDCGPATPVEVSWMDA